jgi:hypothetical protein
MRKKLPDAVRKCVDQWGPSKELDQCLAHLRRDMEGRNWLNHSVLSEEDQILMEFHNKYLEIRRNP